MAQGFKRKSIALAALQSTDADIKALRLACLFAVV